MPRGASPKREREYEELKDKFEEEGRYPGREEEVASRIVNKQRREYGETKEQQQQQHQKRQKKAADPTEAERDLPIDNYQQMTVAELKGRIRDLDADQVSELRDWEENHKQRKSLLQMMDRKLGRHAQD